MHRLNYSTNQLLTQLISQPTNQFVHTSLRALGEVKHMRVLTQEDTGFFYLSEARYFQNVVDLINYYHVSPLSESFTG